jgi:hypothetical protein
MYKHNIMRINYTAYDTRRAQDIINPNTDHKDIMMLSSGGLDSENHEFCYARVLGIYHVNVVYLGFEEPDYRHKRMEFLWVRWFRPTHELPVLRSWAKRRLDVLEFVPTKDPNAFGFVDPASVLRSCHIIPRFAKGLQESDGRKTLRRDTNGKEWREYLVSRFVDRDMAMRYHWGLAVGHALSYFQELCGSEKGREK